MTVFFDSPLNAGSVVVSVDGQSVATVPFDFTRKVVFGIKRKGSGKVKRVVIIPAGPHTVGVQLNDVDRGLVGESTFDVVLDGGSDWTLRVNLADEEGTPEFDLVRAAG